MCQHLLHPILTSFSQAIKVIPSGIFLSPQLRPTGSNNKVNEFKYSLCFTMFKCFIEPNIKQKMMIKTASLRRKHHKSLIDTRTTAQCAVIFVIPMHFWQRFSFKKLWTHRIVSEVKPSPVEIWNLQNVLQTEGTTIVLTCQDRQLK